MRSFNILVHDDVIATANPPRTVYSRPDFNDKLGSVDMLGLFAVTDQVATNGTITVAIEHSADGLNWTAKTPGTPEINAATIQQDTTNLAYGSDGGSSPSLGLVRLSVTIATSTSAHVKLWVTGRDQA